MNQNYPPLSRKLCTRLASLHRKKHRLRHQQYLIEGFRLVESALDADVPIVQIIVTASMLEQPHIQTLLQRIDGPIYQATNPDMNRISDVQTSQGIVAVAQLDTARTLPTSVQMLLILDRIQDPGNVGTLIRTAAWFGIGGVVAGPGTADFYQPKVVRATMGGLWQVHLQTSSDLSQTLSQLRQDGFTCFGADLDGLSSMDWHPPQKTALVLGSEAHGISPSIRQHLDHTIRIPGQNVESLNVAVAGGILMYCLSQSSSSS